MSRPKKNTETRRLIWEHAGKLTSAEIAELAGVTASHVRREAAGMGKSLRRLPDPVNPKRIYWASAPQGHEGEFAGQVQSIIQAKTLPSQSAAIVWAVRFAAKALGEEDAWQSTDEG